MEYLIDKKQIATHHKEFEMLVNSIRKTLRQSGITFQTPHLVGSAKRKMILIGNEDYDFDFQLKLAKVPNGLKDNELKFAFINALNAVVKSFKLEACEDSTHVVTIKKLSTTGKVEYSYDIAILDKNNDGKYIILKNEKKTGQGSDYHFVELSKNTDLNALFIKIQNVGKWNILLDKYKLKKEKELPLPKDKRSHSFSLLIEAVNEVLTGK
jgi:hypothetical protein